jgi:zinc carboxypeptidase
VALGAALVLAAPASAADLLDTSVPIDRAVERSCIDGAGGDGATQRSVTVPATGWLTTRLEAGTGDWDVALYDAQSGRRIGGAASPRASEISEDFVPAGQQVTVQACRLSGDAAEARLSVVSTAMKAPAGDFKPAVVAVSTPTRARKNQLLSLGLDVTEHGGPGFIAVVLRTERDARTLRENQFVHKNLVADLVGNTLRDRAAERSWARSVRASTLPSGRESYRTLADYENEMKTLARENPGLVKPIELPFPTWTGRIVQGIEITTNPNALDGKPVYFQMGLHHAREWPAGEHTLEWAYELVNGYKAGNPRVRNLVERTRTIVVPVVNPDGFNASRSAGSANGREGVETANLAIPFEYHRKNCRQTNPSGDDPPSGNCTQQPATGIVQFGTDPNRNYGGFWGGNGASAPGGEPPGDYNQDYRGNGPFSEPETQNVRDVVSRRQVTTLITNHTASNLVLRPPGLQSLGVTPDENKGYKALSDAMAMHNGYESQFGYELYDTTGTTEDWTYWATGGFGYTFEIGCEDKNEQTHECDDFHFHPSYQKVVAEYEGNTVEADENGIDGKGNREAFFLAQENTADPSRHSVIGGRAQGGALLRLSKSFDTPTSRVQDHEGREGERQFFRDNLDTLMEVPGSNRFEWHINPSTRPLHMEQIGRPARGPASDPEQFEGGPGPSALPCNDFDTEDEACWNDHPVTVPDDATKDNARVTVRIDWGSAASDWDMKLFVDSNGDGSSEGETEELGNSPQFATGWEQVTVSEPAVSPGKKLVARVINFSAAEPYDGQISFQEPDFFEKRSESWRLTCESFSGTVLTSQFVTIGRGERQDPGLQSCIAAFRRAFATGRGCDRPTGRVFNKGLDRARLGRDRDVHLRSYRIGLKDRRNLDKFCLSDRRAVRIGYPTEALLRANLGRARSSAFSTRKAVLVLTSSRRFRVKRVRVGMRTRVARRRIGRRIRGLRVGRNVWFVRRGRGSRRIFKTRAGRVREVGFVSGRLTTNRRRTARLLRSFPLP